MGYNGREFQEPYTMSNGEDLIGSMSNLHVGDQSTSGSSSNPPLSLGRTNLNPNAAEFVPMAYKAPEQSESEPPSAAGGGARLNRTNSINSNASDDEYRKFCRAQLPDDLMPDFDFGDFVETNTEYEEQPAPSTPNWTGNVEQFTYDQRPTAYSPRFEGSTSSGVPRPYLPELRSPVQQQQQQQQQQQSQQQVSRAWNEIGETGTSFTEWGSSDLTFPEDLTESVDPITILASEFPGFASESLAEIYYANGGDLALTVDMLTELELQNQAPPAPAPPSPRDFPALAGLDVSGRSESRAVPDFAAAVRKQAAAQQAAQLQFERNGGVDLSLGGVRGLAQGPGFSREARVAHNERLAEPFHVHEVQAPVAWLETGDSVANLYADMREEARDHARVRNAYFDQARQAYLTGNKALAKELSAKGQWHNEQMKAAHNKAGEAIYWQRNSNAYANSAPGQRLIDLHGLHVGEAIPLLKRELAQMRYNVRSSRQRETVFICVGTGHHTKGSRTPSRLPAAVQRYLLEEEHLQFTEPQAGMLRIIIR